MNVMKRLTIGDRCLFFPAAGIPIFFLTVLSMTACQNPAGSSIKESSSDTVSIEISGFPFDNGTSAAVQLITDEIFQFKVVLQNNGTTTWGNAASGQHGASLLSRGDPGTEVNGKRPDDYNETFGTFFVLYPWQNSLVVEPGGQMTYDTIFRAPSTPGTYTMRWQTAEWPLGRNQGSHISETNQSLRDRPINYFNRPFFGTEIVVDIVVTQREGQPPYVSKPGVLDASDFDYVGSFALPQVWTGLGDVGFTDTKTFRDSGITLRKVGDELRMLLVTGTYQSNLYEIAVPQTLGKIIGNDVSSVPTAALRTNFTGQSIFDINEGYWDVGSMWYDQQTEWLYWTNNATYPAAGYPDGLPILFYAKLEGNQVVNRQSWLDPLKSDPTVPLCSFMGGVTTIPKSFADAYLEGRRLALGFGGSGSIITHRSVGPSLGAVSVDAQGIVQDNLLPIMYYPYTGAAGNDAAPRDGNYLFLGSSNIPPSPWEGRWTSGDYIRSGVFIEYNGKRGYMTFAHQVVGRRGYDYGGTNFWSKHQNAWYFYDWETLGGAANGTKTGLMPSSFGVVDYPSGNAELHTDSRVSGSCFDPETGLLYLYVKRANGSQPLVHVYKVN